LGKIEYNRKWFVIKGSWSRKKLIEKKNAMVVREKIDNNKSLIRKKV
jgi:hypothetical protein